MNHSLLHTYDHVAWQQRVNREAGVQSKFNENSSYIQRKNTSTKADDQTKNHYLKTAPKDSFVRLSQAQERLHGVQQKPRLVPYTRVNLDKFAKTQSLAGYMLDSTYMNASDPNSMRDCGPTRNCQYVATIGDSLSKTIGKEEKRPQYDRFLCRPYQTNQSFYGFGGKKNFGESEAMTQEMISPTLMPNSVTRKPRPTNSYPINRNELVNDYQKNISQSIFSPGVLPSGRKVEEVAKAKRPRTAVPSSKSSTKASESGGLKKESVFKWKMQEMDKQIKKEAKEKKRIQDDLDEIRSRTSQASKILSQHN